MSVSANSESHLTPMLAGMVEAYDHLRAAVRDQRQAGDHRLAPRRRATVARRRATTTVRSDHTE